MRPRTSRTIYIIKLEVAVLMARTKTRKTTPSRLTSTPSPRLFLSASGPWRISACLTRLFCWCVGEKKDAMLFFHFVFSFSLLLPPPRTLTPSTLSLSFLLSFSSGHHRLLLHAKRQDPEQYHFQLSTDPGPRPGPQALQGKGRGLAGRLGLCPDPGGAAVACGRGAAAAARGAAVVEAGRALCRGVGGRLR